MRVLIFGATGMVGQGVLRECLEDAGVEFVQTVGRNATGVRHAKLREVTTPNVADCSSIESELAGFDACFFTLGVSSAGMKEDDYTRLTYDLTLAVATTLARLNPSMTFVYVSGSGTDSTERGGTMWARVKGRTENALMRLPFRAAFMFRPGAIIASHGEISRTPMYRRLYVVLKPLMLALRWVFPRYVLTTVEIGRAMLAVVRNGGASRVLEPPDIAAAAR